MTRRTVLVVVAVLLLAVAVSFAWHELEARKEQKEIALIAAEFRDFASWDEDRRLKNIRDSTSTLELKSKLLKYAISVKQAGEAAAAIQEADAIEAKSERENGASDKKAELKYEAMRRWLLQRYGLERVRAAEDLVKKERLQKAQEERKRVTP